MSFLNRSTVSGFYFPCLVPIIIIIIIIIIMLAVNVTQIRNLNDTYALVSLEF